MLENLRDKLLPILATKKINQGDLAEMLNITRQGFAGMLDKNNMQLSLFVKMCEVLEVNPCIFFTSEYPTDNDLMKPNMLNELIEGYLTMTLLYEKIIQLEKRFNNFLEYEKNK